MFPTVQMVSSILSLHNTLRLGIRKHFQEPADMVLAAANLEARTNTVYLPLSPEFIVLSFLITKSVCGVWCSSLCRHRKSRWSWKHVHLIKSALQMWCSGLMNTRLTDVCAVYTHILGTRDTDFLLWKTGRELLTGAGLGVVADLVCSR